MPVDIASFAFLTSKSVEPNHSRTPKTRRKTKHDKLCLRNFGRCSWWFSSTNPAFPANSWRSTWHLKVSDSPGNSHRPAPSPNQPWSVGFCETGGSALRMSVAKDHLYMIGKELEDESTTLQYFWGGCWLPRSIPHQTRPLTRVPVFFTWPRSIRLPQELIKDPFSTEPWLLMYLGLFWMCCHCTGLFVLSLCHLQHLNHLHSTVNYEKVFTTTTLKIIFVLAGSWGFLILGYNICTNPCLMCCDKNNLQPLQALHH